MRVAVFSDVHGNLPALEAVITAATEEGAEAFWVVGDVVAHGPHPGATVRRLKSLDDAWTLRAVRGNTDRYVVAGDLSPYLLALDPDQVADKERMLADSRASFAWTRDRVQEEGCLDWLARLPVECRVDLPDGSRARASPRSVQRWQPLRSRARPSLQPGWWACAGSTT